MRGPKNNLPIFYAVRGYANYFDQFVDVLDIFQIKQELVVELLRRFCSQIQNVNFRRSAMANVRLRRKTAMAHMHDFFDGNRRLVAVHLHAAQRAPNGYLIYLGGLRDLQ